MFGVQEPLQINATYFVMSAHSIRGDVGGFKMKKLECAEQRSIDSPSTEGQTAGKDAQNLQQKFSTLASVAIFSSKIIKFLFVDS